MKLTLKAADVCPPEVETLLRTLAARGFFERGLLIGSWAFPIYQRALGIDYPLKTFDIDFALDKAALRPTFDLDESLRSMGCLPLDDHQTGLRKYAWAGFEVEFLVHRAGGRDVAKTDIRGLNVTAIPLPFLSLLFHRPITADLGGFEIRVPQAESFFLHKLVVAQRRRKAVKKANDLAQCRALIPRLDRQLLAAAVADFKASLKTRRQIRLSCEEIGFPPQFMN
jgi:hypothetical protein